MDQNAYKNLVARTKEYALYATSPYRERELELLQFEIDFQANSSIKAEQEIVVASEFLETLAESQLSTETARKVLELVTQDLDHTALNLIETECDSHSTGLNIDVYIDNLREILINLTNSPYQQALINTYIVQFSDIPIKDFTGQ
jgi:hypothetical protein